MSLLELMSYVFTCHLLSVGNDRSKISEKGWADIPIKFGAAAMFKSPLDCVRIIT